MRALVLPLVFVDPPHAFSFLTCLFCPLPAKWLNGLFLLFTFLCWVCCCVQFGGVLATGSMNIGGKVNIKVYWNKYVGSAGGNTNTISWDSPNCAVNFCSKCASGGKGLIAMQVFAFLGLTASMFMTVSRMMGWHVGFLAPARKSVFFELVLNFVNTFWFFLSVCIWGGTCFSALNGFAGLEVHGTGFAYLIVCFFFILFNSYNIWRIRADSSCHLGSNVGGDYTQEADANTTQYNPPATYQYNADASAYNASYGSEQPAQSAADNQL